MKEFDFFLNECQVSKKSKYEQGKYILYYGLKQSDQPDFTIKELFIFFENADLSLPNSTYLKRDFIKSKDVIKGKRKDSFKLSRSFQSSLDDQFSQFFENEIRISEKASLLNSPFLEQNDIENAHKMAELYIILHCFENSVRKTILSVLLNKFGDEWWVKTKNSSLENKVTTRKEKENKNKWLTPRGGTELNYLDWGDLVKIIRKFETDLIPLIGDIKFVELRLEDLEKLRNIIAHNGYLTDEDDFNRVVIFFNDWCKQIDDAEG